MNNILNYSLDEISLWMKENGESAFRAKQVFLGYTRIFGILMI